MLKQGTLSTAYSPDEFINDSFFQMIADDETLTQFITEGPSPPADPTESTDYTPIIIAVSVVGGVLLLALLFAIYRLRKLTKLVEEKKSKGEEVPRMSMSTRALSIVKPADEVLASLAAPAEEDEKDAEEGKKE